MTNTIAKIHETRRNFIKRLGFLPILFLFSCENRPLKAANFKIGNISDFPVGETELSLYRLLVSRGIESDNTHWLRVNSMVCTHQTCVVSKMGSEFHCPCHGSRFAKDGKVIQGPAKKPLRWLQIFIEDNGDILVNLNSSLDYKYRLLIEL